MRPLWGRGAVWAARFAAIGFFTVFPFGSDGGTAAAPAEEVWVGHQVVFGKTDVPFMGMKETRSDSYILARVKRVDGAIEMAQVACKVTFREIAGVKVSIPTDALLKLPVARIHFAPDGDGFRAEPWHVGWNKQDIDGDGTPGLSVTVDASLCSGKLHIASDTRSAAVAQKRGNGLMGKIAVEVKQTVLGSDNVCLSLFSSDTVERQSGAFVYERVSPTATCDTLLKSPWPIRAEVKNKHVL